MSSQNERLRQEVLELESRFDTLIDSISAELAPERARAFEAACRPTRADLKVLSLHVLGTMGHSGPFPVASSAAVPAFELPLGLATVFLEGLIQTGRTLDRLAALLADAGYRESEPLGQAVMSSTADFWAHSFLHLKLPLWRSFPELNPFVQARSLPAEDAASATFRVTGS